MAKTQAERLDDIDMKLELLVTQQRVIINQNDKILEFMDAIHEAFGQQEAESILPEPATSHLSTADEIKSVLKDLSGGDEPPKNSASRSWGRGDGD